MMECIFVYKTKLQKCLLTVLMLLYIVVNCGRITLFVVVLVFFGHFDTENAFLYHDKDSRIFQRSFIVPIFFFFNFFFSSFPIFFFFLSLFFLFFFSVFSVFLFFFYYFSSILLYFLISLLLFPFFPLLSSYFCQVFRIFTFYFSNTPITIKHIHKTTQGQKQECPGN